MAVEQGQEQQAGAAIIRQLSIEICQLSIMNGPVLANEQPQMTIEKCQLIIDQ
jgi:hypothetical protein